MREFIVTTSGGIASDADRNLCAIEFVAQRIHAGLVVWREAGKSISSFEAVPESPLGIR